MRNDTPAAGAEVSGLADGPAQGKQGKKVGVGEEKGSSDAPLLKRQQQMQSSRDAGVKKGVYSTPVSSTNLDCQSKAKQIN